VGVAGSYVGGEAGSAFSFGVYQRSREPGPVARLLAALLVADGRLGWTQSGHGANAAARIDAAFALHPGQREQLRETVARCLPGEPRE
jgi:hypothetical protein